MKGLAHRGLPATGVVIGFALVLLACGGGALSLQEYGEQAEDLVGAVNQRIGGLDADLDTYAATADGTQTYWDNRLDARAAFLEGLRDLEPPESAAELHAAVVVLFDRLNAAESNLAAKVATMDPGIGAGAWWETPEGLAARAVDEEVTAICYKAQGEFDKTEDRGALADLPWIPPEMQETVRVAFGCDD